MIGGVFFLDEDGEFGMRAEVGVEVAEEALVAVAVAVVLVAVVLVQVLAEVPEEVQEVEALVHQAVQAQAVLEHLGKDQMAVTVLLKTQVAAAAQVLLVAMQLHRPQRAWVGQAHPIVLAARR